MKSKRKRSLKALKSLKSIYAPKETRRLLKMIMSAAMSSKEADCWPAVDRGEAFAFYTRMQKLLH